MKSVEGKREIYLYSVIKDKSTPKVNMAKRGKGIVKRERDGASWRQMG